MTGPVDEPDLGIQMVQTVHRHWQVDKEWCQWSERGFAWWGHRLRQRVWAEPGVEDDGLTVYRVCAVTDFLQDVPDAEGPRQALAELARAAALDAPVYEPETRRISLFSSVHVHEGTAVWAGRLLGQAAILQPVEAGLRAEGAAELMGGRPAWSDHPETGRRYEPDEMLAVLDQLYAPAGEGESAWADSGEFEQVAAMLARHGILANADRDGLTAEFPFGRSRTSLLRVLTDQRHPQLGSGLMLQLHLPLTLEDAEAARIAGLLNRLEAAGLHSAPALGSWATDGTAGPHPVFVSFVPSALRVDGLMTNLVLYEVSRAVGAGQMLSEDAGADAIEVAARRWRGFGEG